MISRDVQRQLMEYVTAALKLPEMKVDITFLPWPFCVPGYFTWHKRIYLN